MCLRVMWFTIQDTCCCHFSAFLDIDALLQIILFIMREQKSPHMHWTVNGVCASACVHYKQTKYSAGTQPGFTSVCFKYSLVTNANVFGNGVF